MKLYTIPEVAEYAGLSVATVFRAMRSGALEYVQLTADKRRIRSDMLKNWIETGRVGREVKNDDN